MPADAVLASAHYVRVSFYLDYSAQVQDLI